MKKPGVGRLPAILTSKTLASSGDCDLPPARNNCWKPSCRKIRSRSLSGAGVRSRKDGISSGKKSRPGTPLLRWKFEDGDFAVDVRKLPESGARNRRKVKSAEGVSFSARNLAAGLWHLQLLEASGVGRRNRSSDQAGSETARRHVGIPHLCNPSRAEHELAVKHPQQSPNSVPNPKNGVLYEIEPSVTYPNSAMEQATKWDPGCSRTPNSLYRFYGHLMLLEDQQISTISVVSALQAELEQARTHIHELESERQTSKKKLDHFLRKIADERDTWRRREHEKIRAIIQNIKDDLSRERKSRQKMETVNSKLVNELAEAKLSAKRFFHDYEKERKARELMEEVCDELAKEIGEDKSELEVVKSETMKIREEVEEERKMLQMAEVWREERVQMKLIDAKLILEEKYAKLSELILELENFLVSRSTTADVLEIRDAQLLREAASSVKIQDINEFTYQPPSSEDIFSVFEDLQSRDANEREIDPSFGYSPASRSSKIHTVSPEVTGLNENSGKRYSNGGTYRKVDVEEDGSDWETVSRVEDQDSSNSTESSFPSVNGRHQESIMSGSGTGWDENGDHETLNADISEVYSALVKQSKKKGSSISRLWRSSQPPNNGDNCKNMSVEVMNGRLSNATLSNGRVSNGFESPDGRSGEVGVSPQSLGQWSSPDSANPHITRGMKGCIEWPRGTQKSSLKAKLLEARMESQKVQLRQVLKQKI